ncbi:MAG: alpha/beta hydrolase [Bacillota bacterium]|nr:alpha/beta hydrolase [Bacillota bacterium]
MSEYKIDREEWVELNGDRQNIRIRSQSKENPVILFLHGGPGVCDRHKVLHYQSCLAESFTMVLWDQRGSGKSYRNSIKKEELHVEQYVQDAKALVEHLCDAFGQKKIIVAGHSWGTVIGTQLVSRYPEHIAAYIGQGQFADGTENERLSYEFCLREAKRLGDKKALSKLEGNGPVNGVYPTNDAMMAQRDCLTRYGGGDYKERSGMMKSILLPLLKTKEYNLRETAAYAKGALYLSKILWAEVVACDFLNTVKELKMPVLLTQGVHDYNTPTELAKQWFDQLHAPEKRLVLFEESAHSPIKEESEKWGRTVAEFCTKVTE